MDWETASKKFGTTEEASAAIAVMENSSIFQMNLRGDMRLYDGHYHYSFAEAMDASANDLLDIRNYTAKELENARARQANCPIVDPSDVALIRELEAKLKFTDRVINYKAAKRFMDNIADMKCDEARLRQQAAMDVLRTKFGEEYADMSVEDTIADMRAKGIINF